MITRIHKNLHNGLWAITQGGRVVGYADACELSGVTVHINENIKRKHAHKRTVHLWCKGTLTGVTGFQSRNFRTVKITDPVGAEKSSCEPVTYNPFEHSTLTYKNSGLPFTGAPVAQFRGNGRMYA